MVIFGEIHKKNIRISNEQVSYKSSDLRYRKIVD